MRKTLTKEELIRYFEAHALWPYYYPKVYEGVSQWHSLKPLACMCISTELDLKERSGNHLQLLHDLAKYQVPAYFVTNELLDAIINTGISLGLTWEDIPLPYPCGVFVLQQGNKLKTSNGEVSFVGWGDIPAGITRFKLPSGRQVLCNNDEHRCMQVFNCIGSDIDRWLDNTVFKAESSFKQLDSAYISKLTEEAPADKQCSSTKNWPDTHTKEDIDLSEDLIRVCAGLLLAIHTQPTLVKEGKHNTADRRNSPVKQYWSPHILGSNFKTQTITLKHDTQGTAHVRPHWRAGHFHKYRVGPGRLGIKINWIKPIWVCGTITSDNGKELE